MSLHYHHGSLTFEISPGEFKQFVDWASNHNCNLTAPVEGGKLTYQFIPYNNKLTTKVVCLCGQNIEFNKTLYSTE